MKIRITLNENILKYEIEIYCATMANFWHNKSDSMYQNSKQGIYTIINLMVTYMGFKEKDLIKFAQEKLNSYVLADGNKTTTDEIIRNLKGVKL